MANPQTLWTRLRHQLSPLVYLSNNWLSLAGVLVVTASVVFWIILLPTSLRGEVKNPYIGILAFLMLPAAFFAGLAAIPIGIWLRRRRERQSGAYPSAFPPLDLHHPELRRLLGFVAAATVANIIIASQLTYRAVTYMDSVGFCGQTCHTVMQPEFTAYQNSPHSRVECVHCHIGPGAPSFVRSKLSGAGQVLAVTLNNYPRPIPTPVENLRPARETCEACHFPRILGSERLRVITKFAEDEANTPTKTVLLMHIGRGANTVSKEAGIHGVHLGQGVVIEYAHSDSSRQTIPWVRRRDAAGSSTLYLAPGTTAEAGEKLPRRMMDCTDCHNRPAHAFELPERAVDRALAAGEIAPSLPFAKHQGMEILKKKYASEAEATAAIPAAFEQFYKQKYAAIYSQCSSEISRSAKMLLAIYNRNVFPAMKVTWGTYPNNIGHMDFPGCFRCHDDQHTSAGGLKISQDCSSCHNLLAMEEPEPKILTDLGITNAK